MTAAHGFATPPPNHSRKSAVRPSKGLRIASCRGLRLFRGYTVEETARMLDEFNASVVQYAKGDVVIRMGTEAKSHVIVLDGVLNLYDPVEPDRWMFVRTLEAGELFTVSLTMDAGEVRYPCMVRAGSEVTLLKLDVSKVRRCWYRPGYRQFFENLFRSYYEYIGFCRNKFSIMYLRDADERVMLYLRQRAAETGSGEVRVPFRTAEMMAEYLGVNRASLSRSISALVKAGKIEHHGKGHFVIR